MIITGIFHAAIKTNDLKATVDFYTKVLGLREAARPDFGYPGAWLACPTPGGDAIIHIYAGGPALGEDGRAPYGTGAIDHVSISAHGFHEFRERFRAAGLDWREFHVPGTSNSRQSRPAARKHSRNSWNPCALIETWSIAPVP